MSGFSEPHGVQGDDVLESEVGQRPDVRPGVDRVGRKRKAVAVPVYERMVAERLVGDRAIGVSRPCARPQDEKSVELTILVPLMNATLIEGPDSRPPFPLVKSGGRDLP